MALTDAQIINSSINADMQRIIEVVNELASDGLTGGSTSEIIAAAFILNDMSLLPGYYNDVTDAWDRLGHEWQHYVRVIKQDYPEKLAKVDLR